MPTGYTYIIDENNATFEQFVWRCVRAMGVSVHMRDEPMDARIPENIECDPYYERQVTAAKDEVLRWTTMSDEEIAEVQRTLNAKLEADERQASAKCAMLRNRYEAMLARVRAWNPPTADHNGLKEFMLEQLNRAMPQANVRWHVVELPIERYRREMLNDALQDLERATRRYAEHVKRVGEQNRWLAALRASVPQP